MRKFTNRVYIYIFCFALDTQYVHYHSSISIFFVSLLIHNMSIKGKITSFVLYLYTTFQTVSFLTNVDRRCPLLGILLQV
ncbi:hypothetical protein Hanom_Chr09g00770831 [Helianthus anomalus]